jgi:hypothetical protein
MGALHLVQLCQALQARTQAGLMAEAAALLDQLNAEFERVQQALRLGGAAFPTASTE